MLKDKIKAMLALSGKKMKNYSEELGIQQTSISNKLINNSLNIHDLVILGKMTDSTLCYIKNGKVVMEIAEDDFETTQK